MLFQCRRKNFSVLVIIDRVINDNLAVCFVCGVARQQGGCFSTPFPFRYPPRLYSASGCVCLLQQTYVLIGLYYIASNIDHRALFKHFAIFLQGILLVIFIFYRPNPFSTLQIKISVI